MIARPDGADGAISARPDGVRLRVRLTPKASRDALGAIERLGDGGEAMIAHVRALPSEGEANAALTALVAKAVGVARTRVEVVSGRTSRLKTLHIDGDAATVVAALEDLAHRASDRGEGRTKGEAR